MLPLPPIAMPLVQSSKETVHTGGRIAKISVKVMAQIHRSLFLAAQQPSRSTFFSDELLSTELRAVIDIDQDRNAPESALKRLNSLRDESTKTADILMSVLRLPVTPTGFAAGYCEEDI